MVVATAKTPNPPIVVVAATNAFASDVVFYASDVVATAIGDVASTYCGGCATIVVASDVVG